MGIAIRIFAIIAAGIVGFFAIASPAITVGFLSSLDPDMALVGVTLAILCVAARIALLAPTPRTAWGRMSLLVGGAAAALATFRLVQLAPQTIDQVQLPIAVDLGMGMVLVAAAIFVLSPVRRDIRSSESNEAEAGAGYGGEPEPDAPIFAPEKTLFYRREGGADYRAFVQRSWTKAEVAVEPLILTVDGAPCSVISIASRPRGGCYVNVIVNGQGYTLEPHAHQWAMENGPVDVATWAAELLAAEVDSEARRHVQ
ncbi:MAG TPA: hypothetical protein VKV96_20850 [Roseiarcus sp.]|nr:hypothetical protein [Roseiarcus sp.]